MGVASGRAAPGAEVWSPRVWWLSLCCQTGTVVRAVRLLAVGVGFMIRASNVPLSVL